MYLYIYLAIGNVPPRVYWSLILYHIYLAIGNIMLKRPALLYLLGNS